MTDLVNIASEEDKKSKPCEKDAGLIYDAGCMMGDFCNISFDYVDEYKSRIKDMLKYSYPEDKIRDCYFALGRNGLVEEADYLLDIYNNLRSIIGKDALELQ